MQNETFALNQYISYAELVEFSYFGLIYYILDQSLLQIDEGILKWCDFITKWEQVIYYKVGQFLLPSVASITMCGNFITKITK